MNLNLVIDTSHFKPFEYYNAALQTMKDYGAAYNKLEEQLNKIAEEKGEYVLPESSKYREVMDRYNSDFDSAVQDFTQGMNLRNASAIRNLRRRYSSEITPIRTMVENYNKYNDKLATLGPDAIVGTTYGVDDFYGGVNPKIDYRSAKQVELDSTKYFSGINNALTQDPEFKSILGGQYFQQVQRGGLDSGAALQAALVEYNNRTNGKHSEAVQNLLDHMQNVMDAQGVESFSDEAKQRVWNRVAAGLINSIEAPKYTNVNNRGYESAEEKASREYNELQRDYYRQAKELEEEEKNLKLGRIKIDDGGGKYHYEYNLQKAKKILDLRRASQGNTSTKATPHITYGGHRYSVKKVSDKGKRLNTYEVSDIDTGEIITDASLKQGIIDYYNGKSNTSTKVPSSTPQSPKAKVDRVSADQKRAWTG